MKKRNDAPSRTERFVPAQYIRKDGTIETFPNYMISDRGRVGSLVDRWGKRSVMKTMNPAAHTKLGYLVVCLCTRGKSYRRSIHRLVLSSFHPELWSRDANDVDHVDRDPTNNLLSNLRWTDRKGNIANRSIMKKIRVTYLSDGHTEDFDNMSECSKAFSKRDNWCAHIIYKFKGFNAKYNIKIEKI